MLACVAVLAGLALLAWSAGFFVEGASALARRFGIPSLLIGMIIVGFGTSAPELLVSAIASFQGSPGIAVGNAYGSNIANIGLILGGTALLWPITFRSKVLRKELPILAVVTLFSFFLFRDREIEVSNGVFLILVLITLLIWAARESRRSRHDVLGEETEGELQSHPLGVVEASTKLFGGLVVLMVSSRMVVWGAVSLARDLGVSDLVIGLTILAVGTSLPELASSIIAVRKGEHDIALGNVLGSNLFNTLAVVGIAAVIHPITVSREFLQRDLPVLSALTLSLFLFGYGFRGQGKINRVEGGLLVAAFLAYNGWIAWDELERAR